MLVILLAISYITLICWTVGRLTIQAISKYFQSGSVIENFGLTCLIGLLPVTTIAGWLSLFIPLGGWWIQIALLVVLIRIWTRINIRSSFSNQLNIFRTSSLPSWLLFCSSLIVLLLLGSWKIYHPDTLAYHAPIVKWINEYSVVPGLANINIRYGLQNSWFVASSIFSFEFLHFNTVSFLNYAIICWLVFFAIEEIKKATGFSAFLLVIGFGWMWAGFTQIRLTTLSASPDFPAALSILASIYLLLRFKNSDNDQNGFMASMIAIFAVTIKFSALPLLIVPAYIFGRDLFAKRFRKLLLGFAAAIMMLTPVITRNIISSGYPFYPSHVLSIGADWQVDRNAVLFQEQYISAYARDPKVNITDMHPTLAMSAFEWVPGWWNRLSLPDRCLLLLALLSSLILFFFSKRIRSMGTNWQAALLTACSGVFLWWITAPDPRFAWGFIWSLPALVVILLTKNRNIVMPPVIVTSAMICLSAALLGYGGYRLNIYFSSNQIISPAGIPTATYHEVSCGNMKLFVPVNGGPCGNTLLPCSEQPCDHFELRGTSIQQGFRAK